MEAFSYRFPELEEKQVVKLVTRQRQRELEFFNRKPVKEAVSKKNPSANNIGGFTYLLQQILKTSSHRLTIAGRPRNFKRMTQMAKIIDTIEDRANYSRHSGEASRKSNKALPAYERAQLEKLLLSNFAGYGENETRHQQVAAELGSQTMAKLNKFTVLEEAPEAEEASDELPLD